jgi:hypothetical protein
MIFAVTGGRDFQGVAMVNQVLDALKARQPDLHLVHGAAKGLDTLARKWAERNGVPHTPFPADWDQYGKAAGHIRNGQMLTEGKPTLVIAFPGNKGTANMVDQARRAGVRVLDLRVVNNG